MKHPTELPIGDTQRLNEYVALLLAWNRRLNLIATSSRETVWTRHIQDSLQIAPLLPMEATQVADLGSGAGLPGIVLAVVQPSQVFHLIEADKRKAAFLREAARTLGLANVVVHDCRIEHASIPVDVVTARALAPLPRLLPLAMPWLRPGGLAIFPKGRNGEAELTATTRDWSMLVERFPSRIDTSATIFRLSEISPLVPSA